MSFDPINEEEGEDGGESQLPRASAKAAGDNGDVDLGAFSDEDNKKDKKKKDKKDKKDKKKKSSKGGDSEGRSKRSRSKSKHGTEDGKSAKSGKTAGGSQQEEGGERMSAKSKMSYYSSKSKMKLEGGRRERSLSGKYADQQPQIDSTRKLMD
jgi:hypothetical protein